VEHRSLGWERIADCGSMRVVGLRLQPGQHVPEHRNAVPVAMIVTQGTLHYGQDEEEGLARQGELVLINPGERHRYWATEETTAYLVFAGLPGVRSRTWTLRAR
jgi:quercetin dioxygenase-like cupin family protein